MGCWFYRSTIYLKKLFSSSYRFCWFQRTEFLFIHKLWLIVQTQGMTRHTEGRRQCHLQLNKISPFSFSPNVEFYKIIWVTMDSLSWDNGVGAEGYVVSDTLSKPIGVLTMRFTECLPLCHLKTATKASFDHLLILLMVTGFLFTIGT